MGSLLLPSTITTLITPSPHDGCAIPVGANSSRPSIDKIGRRLEQAANIEFIRSGESRPYEAGSTMWRRTGI